MTRYLIATICLTGFLQEIAIVLLRVTTSYRAIELEVSPLMFGSINATYAILPVFFAISVGRIIDRGYEIHVARIAGTIVFIASTGFLLWPTVAGLISFTAIMGIAFLGLTVCLLAICAHVRAPAELQRMISAFMVATGVGQGVGSYIVALVGGDNALPPTGPLYACLVAASALTLASSFLLRTQPRTTVVNVEEPGVPIAEIFRIPKFQLLLFISVVSGACNDLTMIYLPVIGTERGFSVQFVGFLLTIRAVSTVIARLLFAQMVAILGRQLLLTSSALISALCCAAFLAKLNSWSLYVIIAGLGFALSVCQTVTMTMLLSLATDRIRGTVASLRMIGHRVGQFAFPVMASVVATAFGTGMIFAMMGLALVVSAGAVQARGTE